MPQRRIQARIGPLEFDDRYRNPDVDVDAEANTVEKDTINDEIVVQHIGRRAKNIHVEGVIREHQVYTLDQLVSEGEVFVRTHRWAGTAVVSSTTCDYMRAYDLAEDEHNGQEWLYEVTIDLIEVEEVPTLREHSTRDESPPTG